MDLRIVPGDQPAVMPDLVGGFDHGNIITSGYCSAK
jgi:hypothetical protein